MADKTEFKLNIPAGGVKNTSIPGLGKVVKTSKEGIYAVKELAVVGKQYIVVCPVCGKPILTKATEPKVFRTMHKTCNAPIIIKVTAVQTPQKEQKENSLQSSGKTENFASSESSTSSGGGVPTVKEVIPGRKTNARLIWWSITGRKQYILRIGKNYVGRRDYENPSNLSLKDEYASAKSICIDVAKSARGYTFHLTVEHATNPVLINGKEQPEGSSFDLDYDDIIKLGNTSLTLKPVKK